MNLLNCLGIGTVLADKNTDTNDIIVSISNKFPSQDGEQVGTAEEVKTEHLDIAGNTESSTVLESNGEPATWMQLNSNRLTSPDVRQGSKVVVYEWMNSNKKLWTTFGLDGNMRLETIVWVVSASPNITENAPVTPDNYYIFTVSSHKKKIELLTGQGNGEAMAFQLTLNLAEAYFGWMDNLGGLVMHNALERSLTYQNKDGTIFAIDKKDFSLTNKGNTVINTLQSIMLKSKNILIQAEQSLGLKSDALTIDTNTAHLTSAGGWDMFGNVRLNGGMDSTGNIKTSADVIAGTISVRGHVHPGVERGGSNTSVAI